MRENHAKCVRVEVSADAAMLFAPFDRNGPPRPTKSLLKTSPDAAMVFAPFGNDIMRLKVS